MKPPRFILSIVAVVLFFAAGCATTGTDGIVQIGPDTYMIGGLGRFTDFSGSAVKARLYQKAAEFCKRKGGVMIPLSSSAKDSELGQYASAEIQFLCVPPDDPRAQSHFTKEPNQTPEPTSTAVTPDADASAAPSVPVAHL